MFSRKVSPDLSLSKGFHLTFIICSLGYIIDIFDTFLLNVLRVPSLRELGVNQEQITSIGAHLIQMQVLGIVLGALVWGCLADYRGRKTAVVASILLYSIASLGCGWVHSVTSYTWLRFLAGLGLGGEMGAAIALVLESAPQKQRGLYTALIAALGALGAIAAGLVADAFHWRFAYKLGGVAGLALLFLRIQMLESPIFLETSLKKRSFFQSLDFLRSRERVVRFVACIFSGLPIWFWLGICISFAPEIFKDRVPGMPILVSRVVTWNYVGFFIGELCSGWIAQITRSRKKVLIGFMSATILLLSSLLFFDYSLSATQFYTLIFATGFATGYWVLFTTIVGEQFGTNYRGFAVTTAPQILRFLAIPLISIFGILRPHSTSTGSARLIVIGVSILALATLPWIQETFGNNLRFEDQL